MQIDIKVGDKVKNLRCISCAICGCAGLSSIEEKRSKLGEIYTVISIDSNGCSMNRLRDGAVNLNGGNHICKHGTQGEVIKTNENKQIQKMKKVNFVLSYKNGSIVVEEFNSLNEVKKRVAELAKTRQYDFDNFKVYSIKSVSTAKIVVTV